MDSLVGKTLSHYRIVEMIGEGGMGGVYHAFDLRLARDVAIKVLLPSVAKDPERVRHFEQEARAAGALNHPNVCTVLDAGTHKGSPFIVTELLKGETLRETLAAGPLPLRRALDCIAQAAHGLAAAHAKGLVHRDLKPENVFVTDGGRVKLLDFGIAKLTHPDALWPSSETVAPDTGTDPGVLVGTADYMSPEQVRGGRIDRRSDIFSLGAILYESLTGRRPFAGKSPIDTLHAILNDEPQPLEAMARGISPALERLVLRCLEKVPSERVQDASDLAFALEDMGGLQDGALASRPATGGGWRIGAQVGAAVMVALVVLGVGFLVGRESRVDLEAYRLVPFATHLRVSGAPAWSPDGRIIAFRGYVEQEGAEQVWIQGTSGSGAVQVTHPPFSLGASRRLSWSPDSRMIYCEGSVAGRGGIYRVPVEEGDAALVQPGVSWACLSPDGRTLAMLARRAPDREWRVWFAFPPDSTPRRYAPAPLALKSVTEQPQLAFSPDGRSLLIWVGGDKGRQCWLLPWPPANGRRVPALEDVARMSGLSWMPDSRHVVFSAPLDNRPTGLHMADLRSGRRWLVLMGGIVLNNPSVSPDGARIAHSAWTSHGDVIEMPLDGGPPRTLLGGGRTETMPALSADGGELVYVTDARGADEICSLSRRDGSVRRLLALTDVPAESDSEAEDVATPCLSPDRRRLAFSAESHRGGTRLYIAFTGGGAPVPATSEPGDEESSPTWSPDGRHLAYIRVLGAQAMLAVIQVGSADPPTNLMEVSPAVIPEWSPTGEWIAAAADSQVHLVAPDGRTRRAIRTSPGPMAWSPDGRVLYVVHAGSGRASVTAIDLPAGTERVVRDLGDAIPSAPVSPGIRVSVTPDGGSLVYSIERGGKSIWLLEGVGIPRPWYARLLP